VCIDDFAVKKRDAYHTQKSQTRYDYINRGLILKLLYKPLDEIEGLTEQLYERFQTHYSKEKEVIDLIAEFKEILKTQAVYHLESWLNKAQNIGSEEINRFVNGIQRDKEAVINAIAFPYSNGLAEGKINKLKTIKRVMYGRCGFDTLRNKVLLLS
jgi:transposase